MKGSKTIAVAMLPLVLLTGACDRGRDAKAQLASCRLQVNGSEGMAFRTNYLNGAEPTYHDTSYREFMLLCMEAEGHDFALPGGENDRLCWTQPSDGSLPNANVKQVECYE